VVLPPVEPAGPATGRVPEDCPPVTELFDPPRLTALPVTVTGAVTGATTWLPPPMDCEPLVVLPPAEPAAGWDPVVAGWAAGRTELFEPPTLTALPATVTGAVTGATTWLPPPMDCEPLVVFEPVEPAAGWVVPEDCPPETALFDPIALIALPDNVTGAVTGATTWLPPPMDCEPLVVFEPVEPVAGWVVVVGETDVDWTVLLEPTTLTALPRTAIGAVTGAMTWLPPRTLWVPLVSAEAWPAKMTPPAPTRRTAWSPRLTKECMNLFLSTDWWHGLPVRPAGLAPPVEAPSPINQERRQGESRPKPERPMTWM